MAVQGGAGIQSDKQPRGRNVQGMRQAEQRQHRNIAQTLFDLTDIGARYPCSGGERLLGEPLLLPVLAEQRPKALERRVQRGWWARCRVAVGHRPIPRFVRG